MSQTTLNISEIYTSIQGESSYAGYPCTFIRLAGCPLRCSWCDTTYAFHNGEPCLIDDIMQKVDDFNLPLVEITGGEPLAQPACLILLKRLSKKNSIKILLETSGAISLAEVPQSIHIVMDLKCPDSYMEHKNHWDNLKYLKQTDEIKFVLASRTDFTWAMKQIKQHHLLKRCQCLFSPAFGLLAPQELAKWVVSSSLHIRLQMQIHKYIWDPQAQGT